MALQTPISMFDDHEGHFFSLEAICSLKNASPAFRLWYEVAFTRGDFESMASAAVRMGLIGNLCEAPAYFNDICSGIIDVPLALCDLKGDGSAHRRARREIRQMFTPNCQSSEANGANSQAFGVASHCTAPLLARKEVLSIPQSGSLTMFESDDFSANPGTLILLAQDILHSKRSLNAYLRNVYELWNEMCCLPKHADILQLLPNIRSQLSPFLIYYIKQIRSDHYSWFEMQTLRIWAAWLLRSIREEPWFIFCEISALDKHWNVPGGRIDAVRVLSIKGKKISKTQGEKIRAMRKCRFQSVGWIVAALVAEFGRNIQLEIVDWKFSVGDCTKGNREIRPEEVLHRPFASHKHQMERYLTAVVIDTILVANRLSGVNTNLDALTTEGCEYLFKSNNFFRGGSIVYFFPNYSEPLIHPISMSSAEQRRHFIETIMAIPAAQRNAAIRDSYNKITLVLTSRADQAKNNGHHDTNSLNIFDTE